MTIFRDFQGSRPRRGIGIARPRLSKTVLETCRETETRLETSSSESEMGIYRDNLSAIVINDTFLPIIVIAQNSLDLPITDIAFVKYFVIADKLSR